MANCNDLPDKVKQLIVEEKANEKNWNDLPDEVKEMVIKEMTYETRVRLRMCSKSDKYLVDSIPMVCDDITFTAHSSASGLRAFVIITQKSKYVLYLLAIVNKDKSISINRREPGFPERNKKLVPCSSFEEAKAVVQKMFATVFSTGKLHFNNVNVFHDFLTEFIAYSDFTVHANAVEIKVNESEWNGWMKSIAPGVETIELGLCQYSQRKVVKGLGMILAIIHAKSLNIGSDTDISDDELLNFKCTSLEITGKSKITEKGINKLIKKWIANDYPENALIKIKILSIFSKLSQFLADIIEGLDNEVTELDDGNKQMRYFNRKLQIQMSQGKVMIVSVVHGCVFEMLIKHS